MSALASAYAASPRATVCAHGRSAGTRTSRSSVAFCFCSVHRALLQNIPPESALPR